MGGDARIGCSLAGSTEERISRDGSSFSELELPVDRGWR